jgi:SAM-dependent methyltransferase
MNPFKNSSAYYDLLYNDKKYKDEAEYVSKQIKKYNQEAISILSLGCGTGKHDFELADRHYKVTGVDISPQMISIANAKKGNRNIRFIQGDIGTVRIAEKFDVIISLFHVLCYQITDKDIDAAFKTAKYHLDNGGLFIFDVWHSPAVNKQQPIVRIKRMNNQDISVVRIAEPVIHQERHVVDVNYEILIENLEDHSLTRVNEVHSVRHFSSSEIILLAEKNGFNVLRSEEFLTGKTPSEDTWGVCYILKVDE